MKIVNKISLFVLLLILGGTIFSCNFDQDVAPVPTFDGKANCTIAQLLAYHDIGAVDSYDTIPAGTIITGIVTSSDEYGNCYKYITIDDGTAGIEIKINNSTLYHKYPLGQRVFVKCDGLVIGDYRKLPQLGLWANGGMENIPLNKASNYIFCDGMPVSVTPALALTTVPSSAEDLPATDYNRLVTLEGATFEDGGNATYSAATSATSHNINLAGGGTVVLRTSNYADFAGETLPVGTGKVTGILTRYNNYIQLVIRDLNDVQGFTTPTHTTNLYSVNFAQDPFSNGWIKVTSGATWSVLSNSSFSGFYITPGSTTTDSWIISPNISLDGANNPALSFNHRTPTGGSSDNMKCYYTINFTGDVSTTTWTEIPISTFTTASSDFNYSLPTAAHNAHFRFAFRYTGSNSSWYIQNIAITATVSKK